MKITIALVLDILSKVTVDVFPPDVTLMHGECDSSADYFLSFDWYVNKDNNLTLEVGGICSGTGVITGMIDGNRVRYSYSEEKLNELLKSFEGFE